MISRVLRHLPEEGLADADRNVVTNKKTAGVSELLLYNCSQHDAVQIFLYYDMYFYIMMCISTL